MIKCCYKCEKRYPGCHSVCEKYILEKKKTVESGLRKYKESQNRVLYSNTRRSKGHS